MDSTFVRPKVTMLLICACALLSFTQAHLHVVPIDYYNRQLYRPYKPQQQEYLRYKNAYEPQEAKNDYWSSKELHDPWNVKKPQPSISYGAAFVPVAQTDWGRQQFTPSNVHSAYYTSYEDCDPWCRAHCATKRTPDFCLLAGPCMNNCYRIVTNFMRARRM